MIREGRYLKDTGIKVSPATVLLLYYWVVANVLDFEVVTPSDLFIFVQLPVMLFVVLQAKFFEARYRNNVNSLIILFLIIIILINVIRNDFKLILSTAVDVVPVYLILTNKRNVISLNLINFIFIAQIAICIYSYYAGLNPYGFISGQSTISEYPWKVSLFSYSTPPFTSIFSFLILLVNAEKKPRINVVNILIMFLAAYFIIFSGSRTTYIICLVYLTYKIAHRFLSLKKWPRFYLYFPFLVIGFSVFIGTAIRSLDNPLLNDMFIRNVGSTANYKVSEDLDRYIMWKEYLATFLDHWVIGAGYFDVVKFFPNNVGTTETLLPMMLAFHGVVYLIFLAVMIRIMKLAIKNDLSVSYMLIVTFFVACSFYGSFMRGYSLIWIFMFLLIANEFNKNNVLQRRRLIRPRFRGHGALFSSK